jgi:hypothetical protein
MLMSLVLKQRNMHLTSLFKKSRVFQIWGQGEENNPKWPPFLFTFPLFLSVVVCRVDSRLRATFGKFKWVSIQNKKYSLKRM